MWLLQPRPWCRNQSLCKACAVQTSGAEEDQTEAGTCTAKGPRLARTHTQRSLLWREGPRMPGRGFATEVPEQAGVGDSGNFSGNQHTFFSHPGASGGANATSQGHRQAPGARMAGSGIRCAPGGASGSFLQPSALPASTLGSAPGRPVWPPGLPQSQEEPSGDSSGLLGSSSPGALAAREAHRRPPVPHPHPRCQMPPGRSATGKPPPHRALSAAPWPRGKSQGCRAAGRAPPARGHFSVACLAVCEAPGH